MFVENWKRTEIHNYPAKISSSSSKSSDSIYSASSINSRIRMLQRKTQYRQAEFIPARVSSNRDVRQRVSSARLHRFKSIQNQLNEALQQNAVGFNPFSLFV